MEGEVKAIEIQGIVRNRTKLGVQDGQAEDLINLRFVDGSWRASGDGRLVHTMSGTQYTQLYVHTNVYHHLLGVAPDPNNNDAPTLWWFANIENDGVTFTPLANRVEIAHVSSDNEVDITQTGHLLAIITGGKILYSLFKTGTDEYNTIETDVNGAQSSREIYPYGNVHFNIATDDTSEYRYETTDDEQYIILDNENINVQDSPACIPKVNEHNEITEEAMQEAAKIWQSQMLKTFEKASDANRFTGSILAVVAVKLYDGTYAYASAPILLSPRERYTLDANRGTMHNGVVPTGQAYVEGQTYHFRMTPLYRAKDGTDMTGAKMAETLKAPVYTAGVSSCGALSTNQGSKIVVHQDMNYLTTRVRGYDVLLSLGDLSTIVNNKDVFKGIGVFVTKQVYPYDMSYDGYKKGIVYTDEGYIDTNEIAVIGNATYFPSRKTDSEIAYELMHSPFYLLRDYSIQELMPLQNTTVKVDLTDAEYKYVVKNIENSSVVLQTEFLDRTEYIPKAAYSYNQRLHIANYKSIAYYGYPIDLWHLNNQALAISAGEYYKGVLPDVEEGRSDLQYERSQVDIDTYQELIDATGGAAPYFLVKVHIDSQQGEKVVSRYIPAYDTTTPVPGRADFIDDLGPLLTYPDVRAKKMEIYYINYYISPSALPPLIPGWYAKWKEFNLKPHPYLNMAYFINPDFTPIVLSDFTPMRVELSNWKALADMQNIEEYYPNGLKVSSAQNPMFFPVENTYQVGSAEILALMSNAIAVGTGQTGAAPLYVFCKDGVYALFVDASGQMTYSNSRVLARDVCNNPRSVTPTDDGVVFTTDRGLMMIAGEQVQEIGAPAEGDVWQYAVQISRDYYHFLAERLTLVAELPQSLCTLKDFLTYLRGAIVNYNHNERELMVTNPAESYSYVRDRDGNWSRRDYTAVEYVNSYPTSYRVETETVSNQNVRKFYKVDEEGDNNTPLEQRKEADNQFFYLSNVIKLDSIGFKQGMRFVVRGQFTTLTKTVPGKSGQTEIVPLPLGCYVFGSYDGRKWGRLGGNEKAGSFRDIGCKVERTDMRFFRVCLAGQITGDSRIDYMEMSVKPSVLNGKIR